ncbi:MAG: hypothetical protein KF812_09690 [Fimbriimonadaceae bacterium]|nr:hypothetical protein [Fimbriimonadaceae bacterium]
MARKKRAWIWWTAGGVAAVLGLGYALFAQTGIPHYYFAAPEIYAQAKALGVPMTAEEFDPLREGENAGQEYVVLCQQVLDAQGSVGQDVDRDLGAVVQNGADRQKIRALMEEKGRLFAPLLDQMEELSRVPICQIPRDYDDPVVLLLPELASIKSMAKEQMNLAVLDALDGRRTRATERVRSVVRMSDQIRQGPLLIEYLVATACHNIAIKAAQRCLAADPQGAAEYASALFENEERERQIPRVLRNEMYYFVATMRNYDPRALHLIIEGNATPLDSIQKDGLPNQMYNRAAMAYGLEAYMPILEVLEENGDQFDRDRVGEALGDFSARMVSPRHGLQRTVAVPAEVLLPMFGRIGEELTALETREACLKTLAQWVQSGQRPTTVPADPFSGGRLKLRQEGQTLIVYSFGKNKKDDGGVPNRAEDIVAHYTPGEWWR